MPSKFEIAEGRKRLIRLLPAAKAELEQMREAVNFRMGTGIAKASTPYIREDNFDSLVVYKAPLAGWHCDLHLKNVPTGVSDVMGTPTATPCKTREEAEEFGVKILVGMLLVAEQQKENPKQTLPVFELFGRDCPLLPELIDEIEQKMQVSGVPISSSLALAGLEMSIKQFFPDGFSWQVFDKSPGEKKKAFVMVLHLCAAGGLIRYPEKPDGTPSGHFGGGENVKH